MIQLLKRALRRTAESVLSPYLNPHTVLQLGEITAVDRGVQKLLALQYRALLRDKATLPSFDEAGFRVFSQTDEDGILLYLFSILGTVNRRAVEIGAGDGVECNTANLTVNHGWTALLVDGNADNVRRGQRFYANCRDTCFFPPAFLHAWVDVENVNALIAGSGFAGEIDLLSIDLDGVDYWIWRAIDCVSPRVVVVEYQNALGPEQSLTIPYRRDFNRFAGDPEYCGASLAAFVKLGRARGYRLVGCNRYGFNAFFVRANLGEDALPEVPVEHCLQHPRVQQGREARLRQLLAYEWVEV